MPEHYRPSTEHIAEKPKGFNIAPRTESSLVEQTVGRVLSFPENLLLAIPSESFKNANSEIVTDMKARFESAPWKGNTEIYLNHAPFWRQMKRNFSNERRTNLLNRALFGSATTTTNWLAGKFFRSSAYNPYSESIQLYKSNKGIVAREMGRALDYESANHPNWKAFVDVAPIARSRYRWRAASNAMKHLDSTERREAQKVLEPLTGEIIGGDIAFIPSLWGAPLVGLVAGHIHARNSDTNLFYNGEAVVQRQKGTESEIIQSPKDLVINTPSKLESEPLAVSDTTSIREIREQLEVASEEKTSHEIDAIENPLHPGFMQNEYTVRQKVWDFKGKGLKERIKTAAGAIFEIKDKDGNPLLYAQQQGFARREDIRIYSDADRTDEQLAITTPNILDTSARYDVRDSKTNQDIGSWKRFGAKSILRNSWIALSPEGREIGKMQEKSRFGSAPLKRAADIFIKFIPLDIVPSMDFWAPKAFEITSAENHLVAEIRNNRRLGYSHEMKIKQVQPSLDRRMLTAASMLVGVIEESK